MKLPRLLLHWALALCASPTVAVAQPLPVTGVNTPPADRAFNGAAEFVKRSNTAEAINALQAIRVQARSSSPPDAPAEFRALRGMGLLELSGGNFQAAKNHLEEAARMAPGAGVSPAVHVDTLIDLGIAQSQQRAIATRGSSLSRERRAMDRAAADRFREAMKIADEQGLTERGLIAEANLLRLYLLADALDLVAVDTELPAHAERTLLLPASPFKLSALVGASSLIQEYEQEIGTDTPVAIRKLGLRVLTSGLQLAKTMDEPRLESYVKGMLGTAYEEQKRHAEAMVLTESAVALAYKANALDAIFRWEWQTGRLLSVSGNPTAAQAAMSRAVSALEQLRKSTPSGSRKFFERWVSPLYRENADLLVTNSDLRTDSSSAAQAMLEEARASLESLKRAEIEDFLARECFEDNGGTTRNALPAHVAIVYPMIHKDRLDILVETSGQLRRFSSKVEGGKLGLAAEQLRNALASPTRNERHIKPASDLYNWLVRPMLAHLRSSNVSTLVFVPDGKLRIIPLAVLFSGEQFLLEQFAVASSLSVELPQISDEKNQRTSALGGGISVSVRGFSPLANVVAEIETLRGRLVDEGVGGQDFLNERFALDQIDQELLSPSYDIAHFATHGEFSANYESSFILMFDGNMTLSRLQNTLQRRRDSLGKPLDLLVLSACETAAGNDRATLGLAGMAVQSGVRSVLGTLWKVIDASSVTLMDAFYEELLTERASKVDSLRAAQLALLASKQYSHPRYWSPYILLGDWR